MMENAGVIIIYMIIVWLMTILARGISLPKSLCLKHFSVPLNQLLKNETVR